MMTALLDPEAAAIDGDTDESDFHHYYCCDDRVSLCGLDISDYEDVGYGKLDGDTCPLCVFMLEARLPCPVPGCPCRPQG